MQPEDLLNLTGKNEDTPAKGPIVLGPIHYRLVDTVIRGKVILVAMEFEVIKETSLNYWVSSRDSYPLHMFKNPEHRFIALKAAKQVRMVSKTAYRRYCYPDMESAIKSFTIRKMRQVQHLTGQLERATVARDGIVRLTNETPIGQIIDGLELGKLPQADIFLPEDY